MAYRSRKSRSRMAEAPMSTASEESVTPTPEEAPMPEKGEEISAFVPMGFFKGRTPKVGQEETVRIESIDPETGEVEMVCVYGGSDKKSMSDQMDEAIPEEEGIM